MTEIENLYRRALAIQDRSLGREHPATALTLNNLGGLLARARRLRAGRADAARRARPPWRRCSASSTPTRPRCSPRSPWRSTTRARWSRPRRPTSAPSRSRARSGNPRALLVNAASLGYSLAKRGRYREALPYYKEAVETVDFLYSQTRGYSEETRAAFLQQFSAIYRETIRVLLQLHRAQPAAGYDREALAIASRNQSRVFTELMRQADVARFSGEPAFVRLRERRDQLQERVAQLRNARATVPVTLANAAARVAEFDAQLTQASIDLIGVEEQLWREYPRFMELANPRPVTRRRPAAEAAQAGRGAAVLRAAAAGNGDLRGDARAVPHGGHPGEARQHRRARARACAAPIEKVAVGESVLFLRDVDPEALHSLYRDLLAPVAGMIAGRDKLLIVADGPLQTMPFELLVATYGGAERSAFERAQARGRRQRASGPTSASTPASTTPGAARASPTCRACRRSPRSACIRSAPGSGKLELVAFADPLFAPDAQHAMSGGDAEGAGAAQRRRLRPRRRRAGDPAPRRDGGGGERDRARARRHEPALHRRRGAGEGGEVGRPAHGALRALRHPRLPRRRIPRQRPAARGGRSAPRRARARRSRRSRSRWSAT